MILGIDASNLRAGGGVTHLVELLSVACPKEHGFQKVIVWGGKTTLGRLSDRPWLEKVHQPLLDRTMPFRFYWQHFRLAYLARSAGCDLLFVPGGSYTGQFRPFVTMSRTMLPFDANEIRRYGNSLLKLKLLALQYIQSKTFRKANGLIFLSDYARNTVSQFVKLTKAKVVTIPHGVNNRFLSPPKVQKELAKYSADSPFYILYVSHIEPYKHQWIIVEAVAILKAKGYPVVLDIVGAPGNAMARFNEARKKHDPAQQSITYHGAVPFEQLHNIYQQASLFVYASTCENLPNTLLEAMASGLPIASSNKQPMPEVLGDGGIYFDPESVEDTVEVIIKMLQNVELRTEKAQVAHKRAKMFSWEKCSHDTFAFLANVVMMNQE